MQKTVCLSTRYFLSTWSMSDSQAGPWGIQTGSHLGSLCPQGQNLRGTYRAVVGRGTTFSQSPTGILISHNQAWLSLREKLQMVVPQFPHRTPCGCQSRGPPSARQEIIKETPPHTVSQWSSFSFLSPLLIYKLHEGRDLVLFVFHFQFLAQGRALIRCSINVCCMKEGAYQAAPAPRRTPSCPPGSPVLPWGRLRSYGNSHVLKCSSVRGVKGLAL